MGGPLPAAPKCDALGVPLIVERVVVARRESLEARARTARYRALAQHLPAGGYLLTAHHRTARTLLALKRGSRSARAGSMRRASPSPRGLIRPLLDCSRASLQRWAEGQGLNWIEDDSNQDERFDRNFLRAQILPRLQARWPTLVRPPAAVPAVCRAGGAGRGSWRRRIGPAANESMAAVDCRPE